MLCILLFSPLALSSIHVHLKSDAQTGSPIGVVIPLYTYPGNTWSAVIQAKEAYPSVPFIVVINPASGPGSSLDSNYAQGIVQLQAAGITVLGYVDTAFASDSLSSVESNVNLYSSWYHVNGIMFDDMSNAAAEESYYAALNAYVKSIGMTFTMGNPGVLVPNAEVDVFNLLDIYESSGIPAASSLTYNNRYPASDFSFMAYGVSSFNTSLLLGTTNEVSYVYVTDAGLPNPYDTLPSYFTSLIAGLASLDSSPTITVQSVSDGSSFNGMWTTIQSGGNTVASGFTPLTFTGTIGEEYTVSVANYQNYIFTNWQDGTTTPSETFTLTQNTQLTAYYANSTASSISTSESTSSNTSTITTSQTTTTQSMASSVALPANTTETTLSTQSSPPPKEYHIVTSGSEKVSPNASIFPLLVAMSAIIPTVLIGARTKPKNDNKRSVIIFQ